MLVTVASMTPANSHSHQMKAGRLSSLMNEQPFAEAPEREERRGSQPLMPQGTTGVPNSKELTAKQQGRVQGQRCGAHRMF